MNPESAGGVLATQVTTFDIRVRHATTGNALAWKKIQSTGEHLLSCAEGWGLLALDVDPNTSAPPPLAVKFSVLRSGEEPTVFDFRCDTHDLVLWGQRGAVGPKEWCMNRSLVVETMTGETTGEAPGENSKGQGPGSRPGLMVLGQSSFVSTGGNSKWDTSATTMQHLALRESHGRFGPGMSGGTDVPNGAPSLARVGLLFPWKDVAAIQHLF